jgi:hypothetical protein
MKKLDFLQMASDPSPMEKTEHKSSEVRYIKLGEGGRWARRALEAGELPFGYAAVPHEVALQRRDQIAAYLAKLPQFSRNASNHARQIYDFCNMDENCIWITFEDDHLWWTRASKEIVWLGDQHDEYGARIRRCIGAWSNRGLNGKELIASKLSTKLTTVAAFRMTLCEVKAKDYLLRRIAGVDEPLVAKANELREQAVMLIAEAIGSLHWADFETLVDLVFARNGWNRASALGGITKDVDLELENAMTAERAFVQVKSVADQSVFDDYIERFDRAGTYQRMFFVCHSTKTKLAVPERNDIHLWEGERLASIVLKSGLFDWVLSRAA